MYRWYLSGILGLPPEDLDMSSISAAMANYHLKTACNVATFVGHGPIRVSTAGMRDVPLRGERLNEAKRLVKESIEQGAVGFATGLSYFPHSYSDTEELVELCRTVASMDSVYVTHIRTHNKERSYGGGGIKEALEIGRQSGVKVHIEHYRTHPEEAGMVDDLVADVDLAKAQGVDVTLECYPYPVGSSFPMSHFQGSFHEGGPEAIMKRLSDPEEKKRYVDMLAGEVFADTCWTWIRSERNRHLEGMYWGDVARDRGVSIGEMVMDVMREENLACGHRGVPPQSVRIWRQQEADQMELLSRDDYMVGSDAIPVGGLPHPRAWGAFPRVIGRLRRRHGIPLEQIVQRVTQNPARRFQLSKRGTIKSGNFADLVLFDPNIVNDVSSFEDPKQPPVGIPFVIVNGQVAVDHGHCSGVLAGEAIL